jgi:hypothetical protein
VHIGDPSLFRFCEFDKINTSLILLLFKPVIKFDIAYSPPIRRHLCPFRRVFCVKVVALVVISFFIWASM